MLRSLFVRDYALIEELDVEFESGLNIITGETGAGKSILLGALKLILGERASTEAVRQGARKAVVEGVFDDADGARLTALLRQHDIEPNPGGVMIVRREVTDTHSRAFINDVPATVQVLKEIAGGLIDLHGQHDHQSLLRSETHLTLLDDFGGLGGLAETYRKAYAEVARLHREHSELVKREAHLAKEKELVAFQIEEIDRVAPRPNEEDEMNAERRILENAELLHESTASLYSLLAESDVAVYDLLVRARNELQDLARVDSTFEDVLGEIRSAEIVVNEATQFLQDYNSRIEFNPERLDELRERLGEIEYLKRKYGGTLESVLAHREEIGKTYDLAADFEGALARYQAHIAEAEEALGRTAARLSAKRQEVATRIREMIEDELATLGMPHSKFEVRIDRREDSDGWIRWPNSGQRIAANANGADEVEFYISTNLGEDPRPLVRVASGGEISRIMLALKTILARSERLPILVFDEIDTGISGAMARRVGESMQRLAQYHQIIVITHLPQIASLGDQHYAVEKGIEDGRTTTHIRRLPEEERAGHLAMMLSGQEDSVAALENARALMEAGRRT
ncbi:DNA repair protein RecN [soil metagenome]